MKKGIEIFFSYAHAPEDEKLRDELIKHLSEWKRQELISPWHDRDISAGTEWQYQIDSHLNTAQIILLLVSPDFMASDYCNSIEVKQAMRRHVSGDACVIPIILRPVPWKDAPFGKLQALPKDAKPVTLWSNQDEAFELVAAQIKVVVEDLLVERYLKEAEGHLKEGNYTQAIDEYKEILDIQPETISAHQGIGKSFSALKQHEEALAAYDRALRLDSKDVILHQERGDILFELKRYEQALAAYDQALRTNPQDPFGYVGKGYIFLQLHQYQEALAAYEHALRLHAHSSYFYGEKGDALESLKHFKENILTTIEQLLPSLQPSQQPDSSSSTTRKVQIRTLSCLHTIKHPHTTYFGDGKTPEYSIVGIAMSPDEKHIASGGQTDRIILIHNVKTKQVIQTIQGFTKFSRHHLLFSSNGQTLVGGAVENELGIIKMWNVKNGKVIRPFMAGSASDKFDTIAMDSGQQILVGSSDKQMAVMDFNTGEKLRQSPENQGSYRGHLAVSFVGEVIVIASSQKFSSPGYEIPAISLYDIHTLRWLHTIIASNAGNNIDAIAISPDGQELASGHRVGLVSLWSLPSGQHIRTFSAHEKSVTAIAYNSDGQKLITGSSDSTIKIWGEK